MAVDNLIYELKKEVQEGRGCNLERIGEYVIFKSMGLDEITLECNWRSSEAEFRAYRYVEAYSAV